MCLMSKFFIHRPIFAIALSLIIVCMGLISFLSLPVSQYPNIAPPTVEVSTVYMGANSATINQTVAQVVEKNLVGIEGLESLSSKSDDSGSYFLIATFEQGTDGDIAAVKVQNAINQSTNNLPDVVKNAGINTETSVSGSSFAMALYADNNQYDTAFLKNYIDVYLSDRIKQVNGVGKVQCYSDDYSMHIWLYPDKMARMRLTVSDISSAIERQNVQASVGTTGLLPTPDIVEKQMSAHVKGRLNKPEEFENIILKSDGNGNFLRLKDVAKVETGIKSQAFSSNVYTKDIQGAEAVPIIISLTADANEITTLTEVKKVMEEVAKDFPPGLKYKVIVDSTRFIETSIREVAYTFFEALLLVVIIVYLFLQNWRATVIPVIAIPVSLIGTFVAFSILNFTINTITLFAMVLAIGLVVDDAIVVIENVEKHMNEEKISPLMATEKAMAEVQGPVVAIAFVLAAVFIPTAFLGGISGVLYNQFAMTITISMVISAFVALTLTPALCATILKPIKKENRSNAVLMLFNKYFNFIHEKYSFFTEKLLHHLSLAIVFILIVTGSTVLLYQNMPSTFVPMEDQGNFTVDLTLPEGASLNHTKDSLDRLCRGLMEEDTIDNIIYIAGFGPVSDAGKSNAGMLMVGLKDWDERTGKGTDVDSIIALADEIGREIATEGVVTSFNSPSLPGLGTVGGISLEVQDREGRSDVELDEIAKKILTEAEKRPELKDIFCSHKINSPILDYELDRERIAAMGIELNYVFNAMQVNYGGYDVNDFTSFGRNYKVMLQAAGEYRDSSEGLRFMYVRNTNGDMIPVSDLVKVKNNSTTSVINRFNNVRSISFQGTVNMGYSSGQAIEALEEIISEQNISGINIEWSGQTREELKSGNESVKAAIMSILFVFLCLACLYESWSVPFAVLLIIPLGVFGALFSEYVLYMLTIIMGSYNDGLQISIYLHIGVIMLIGLSAKNAILIVEFAKKNVDNGEETYKATLNAAKMRFRPIIMTSLAFIIGCIPLALATGAGAAARNNMGVAVVGGMLFITFFGVFLTPMFYLMVCKLNKILLRWR